MYHKVPDILSISSLLGLMYPSFDLADKQIKPVASKGDTKGYHLIKLQRFFAFGFTSKSISNLIFSFFFQFHFLLRLKTFPHQCSKQAYEIKFVHKK